MLLKKIHFCPENIYKFKFEILCARDSRVTEINCRNTCSKQVFVTFMEMEQRTDVVNIKSFICILVAMANFHDSHTFQSNNSVVFLLVLNQIQVCRSFFMFLIRLHCYCFNSLIFVTLEALRFAHFKFSRFIANSRSSCSFSERLQ